jgi:hypothetical protein
LPQSSKQLVLLEIAPIDAGTGQAEYATDALLAQKGLAREAVNGAVEMVVLHVCTEVVRSQVASYVEGGCACSLSACP